MAADLAYWLYVTGLVAPPAAVILALLALAVPARTPRTKQAADAVPAPQGIRA